jgi:hypothetical protein
MEDKLMLSSTGLRHCSQSRVPEPGIHALAACHNIEASLFT